MMNALWCRLAARDRPECAHPFKYVSVIDKHRFSGVRSFGAARSERTAQTQPIMFCIMTMCFEHKSACYSMQWSILLNVEFKVVMVLNV